MKIHNALKFTWALLFLIICSFTTSSVYAADTQAKLDGFFLGQDQNVLKIYKNATKIDNAKLGTSTYTLKRKNNRELIIVADTKTNKIVQIALLQKGTDQDNRPVFDHFRFNQTRNRDIIKTINTPSVKAISSKYLTQIMPNIKDLNVLQYFMKDDALLTFITQPLTMPENANSVIENGKAFIIDPSLNNRLKEDVRIADGTFKAIVLTNSAYATTLIGRDIKENTKNVVAFTTPDTKNPQETKPYRLLNQYKAGDIYNGPKHALSFSDENEPFRTSQAAIRDGFKAAEKPLFASEYAVIPVIYSPQSNDYYFYNLKTGKLNKFPLGADNHYLKLITRPDLTVLEALWEEGNLCKRAYYQFDNGQWTMLKTENAGYADACETQKTILAQ